MSTRSATSYVVDGRFLSASPTGLHRVARDFVVAARAAGLDADVWAPTGTVDPLVDRIVASPSGRAGGRLWEQVVLPAAARGRPIWSLTNTAPLLRPGAVVVHDLAASVGPQWFAGSMRLYAATVLAGARRAHRVITVSQAVRCELIEHGVSAERIAVVSPGVDPRFAPAGDAAIAAVRATLRLTRPYVVLVGWADPRKDVATALAAHRQVVGETPHDLVLVGEAHPSFAPVTLPTDASVRRVGRVSDDDLVALLSGAQALLYPSRYEGFGLPPLEALACGTPALASDIAALRESTQGLVRLIPPGDVTGWAHGVRDAVIGRLSAASAVPAPRATGPQLVAALAHAAEGSRDR